MNDLASPLAAVWQGMGSYLGTLLCVLLALNGFLLLVPGRRRRYRRRR